MPTPRGRLTALTLSVLVLLACATWAAPARAASAPAAGSVTLTVLDVSPSSPDPSISTGALTVTLRLRNNTAEDISGIQITGDRSPTHNSQADLNDAMAHPTAPAADSASPIDSITGPVDLPKGATQDEVFTTTTGIPVDRGICLCGNGIYALYFTASVDRGGTEVTLATAQTYVPSFDSNVVSKVQVAWVWPLLDRPHRLTSSTEFSDDNLTQEISPGGRLDRALAVVEAVTANSPTPVPMTLLMDPDLIDELEVMAEGSYTVEETPGPPVPGKGTGLAAAWLARLRDVLTQHPAVELDLTSYGDPDVDGLHRDGLGWSSGIPADAQVHVSTALSGVTPLTDLVWPIGGVLTRATLNTLTQQGTRTVLLNDTSVPGIVAPTQDSLAALPTASGTADVGVLDSSIESWANKVFTPNGAGAAYLSQFVAQVALHSTATTEAQAEAANNGGTVANPSPVVVITPPRILDVDPAVAERAILDTTTSFWAKPVMLRDALHAKTPRTAPKLIEPTSTVLPAGSAVALHYVADSLPGLDSLFSATDRTSELGTIPTAAQLAASCSLIPDTTAAVGYAARLRSVVEGYRSGVRLVEPARGYYTLTSTRSSIPITIANDLGVPVYVNVSGFATGGLSGFSATPIESREIPAHTTIQVRMQTHFERTGRIEVEVNLSTPASLTLGEPILLTVRSTALGTIGIVITAVAGVVLVIALCARVWRRVRQGRRDKARAAT